MTIMKAISLWQPWAPLIACGAKPYETRSFAPPASLIGQTIAIHVAKKIDKGAAQFAEDLMYGQHKDGGFNLADGLESTISGTPDALVGIFRQATMPIGCVVAIARLDAAFQLGNPAQGTALPAATVVKRLASRQMSEYFTVRYDDFGDYAPGRWAWLLRDVKPLNPPIEMKGRQGFRSPAGMVGACMTTPSRFACVVPFGRRTTVRADFEEWICGDHWCLIDKVRRQVYGRHLRRWRRYGAAAYGPAAARSWRRMVEQAIQRAAGVQ
jgi:activating signal cointegrator 1